LFIEATARPRDRRADHVLAARERERVHGERGMTRLHDGDLRVRRRRFVSGRPTVCTVRMPDFTSMLAGSVPPVKSSAIQPINTAMA